MLHYKNPAVKELLLQCNVGIEKESLRITGDGRMARTRHPFDPDDPRITRDFCENQTEINTSPCQTAREAVAELGRLTRTVQETLSQLPNREYLWPFSNPPYLADEEDVPVAIFEGARASKTTYREHLAATYGRLKMAFCGIHFNFSFGDDLLRANFNASGDADFQTHKNELYLNVAEKVAAYGWLVTAATAASPALDGSFLTQGLRDGDAFVGMASPRCSELGYWNHFTPILNYDDVRSYAASIRRYVDEDLIKSPTELYYPVRLKPRGLNNLQTLSDEGVNHVELRMFDLNPLVLEGLDARDATFAQLLLVFLASTPRRRLTARAQVRAAQNFKNAARFDLSLVKVLTPNDAACPMLDAGRTIVAQMKKFFADQSAEVLEALEFQESKFVDPENRYADKVLKLYGVDFWRKGIELAKRRQAEALMTPY